MNAPNDLNEAFALLRNIYEQQLPFHRLLGIKIESMVEGNVVVRIDMRRDLIGNFVRNILHGGVISSVLDLTGGVITSVDLLTHLRGESITDIGKRLSRIGTIDLRVDYLRAGQGDYFLATGTVLRRGKKVAVVRTELENDQNLLIAAGTGTYLIG